MPSSAEREHQQEVGCAFSEEPMKPLLRELRAQVPLARKRAYPISFCEISSTCRTNQRQPLLSDPLGDGREVRDTSALARIVVAFECF